MSGQAAMIQALAGGVGEAFAQMSETQQRYLLERAYAEFGKIDLPSLEAIMAEELGPSAMEQMKADPELQGIERDSLDELVRIGRSGGMTLEDRANLGSIQGQTARRASSANARVRDDMSARGISGGSAELAMRMKNNQDAAQRAHEGGLEVAGQAQRRAMDSIIGAGRMAGSMGERDFEQRGRAASAADARSRYNADGRMRAKLHNSGLEQQDFENRMARTSARAGQGSNLAGFYGTQAQDRRALSAGIGKAGYEAAKGWGDDEEDEDW